jgi:hypothetical protein
MALGQDILIGINPANESFYLPDRVNISVSLENTGGSDLRNITVISQIVGDCTPMYAYNYVDMEAGKNISFESFNFQINEYYSSGRCLLNVHVMDKGMNQIAHSFEEFRIEGTLKRFEPKIRFCMDEYCNTQKTVFRRLDNVCILYSVDAENVSIDALISYPDKTQKIIGLPYCFQAERLGTYRVNASFSKEGYVPLGVSEPFGVIEGETQADTSDEKRGNVFGSYLFYIGVVLAVAIALLAIKAILDKRRRREVN